MEITAVRILFVFLHLSLEKSTSKSLAKVVDYMSLKRGTVIMDIGVF